MRLIHTADWHVGKAFRFARDELSGQLQGARLDAIETIGRLAREHGAGVILVAGDVFDDLGVADRTLRQPLERMRAFPELRWHLIPGNHDPVRARGVWDRLARIGPPDNVLVHLQSGVVALAEGATLLAAPGGAPAGDPTAWMDAAPSAQGALRIGLAHGPARTFASRVAGSAGAAIDPARPAQAGLDYLALGDWHGTREEAPACWYSGSPEPDRFDQPRSGQALLVELPAPGAPARVTPIATACFRWEHEEVALHGAADVDRLEARLRARQSEGELSRLLLDLELTGTLSLTDRRRLEARVIDPFASALAFLRVGMERLGDAPAPDDLDAIATGGGAVRRAAERLLARTCDPADPDPALARAALLRLARERRAADPA